MEDLRMYILVNANMSIGAGKLAAQVGHAVQLYVHYFHAEEIYSRYMRGRIKKIILFAPLEVLEKIEKEETGIVIRDAGFTELEPNTLTCVNIGILDKNNIPEKWKFIEWLKLVK